MDKKWNIRMEDIKSDKCARLDKKFNAARATMNLRTADHELFGKVAHNMSLIQRTGKVFSEGSTQAAMRKMLTQSIQRVPDGQLITQYDKNSKEAVWCESIFEEKVMTSEFDGKDMLKNLMRTAMMSYQYCFGCVVTGFEKDLDGDVRVSYRLINWNDVYPDPDCDYIEEAEWYIIRQYLSHDTLKSLLGENDSIKDSTYDENVVKYLIESHATSGQDYRSVKLADGKKGVTKIRSVEVRTLYRRGSNEFITWVPTANAILRTVKNYDPRKDVPVHFMILQPDPDFPLGVSQIMWTLGHQQFADGFQTTSYELMMLAARPPLMMFGNLPNPKIAMKPGAIWPIGTNPNNKIENFQVETSTLNRYGDILEQASASMMRNLGVVDGTVASDAKANYSGTPQGVEAQREDKTISVNSIQKRVEIFFSEWANHAMRSYVNAMSGVHELTVSEDTRRRIYDVDGPDSIDGNKIAIDFSLLKPESINFQVRTGSLTQSKSQEKIDNIQGVLIPLTQMLGNLSEDNHSMFENSVLLPLIQSWLEAADIDVSQQTGSAVENQIMLNALAETMAQVQQQQGQIGALAGQQANMLGAMPPEQQQVVNETPMPTEMPPEAVGPPAGAEMQPMPAEMMPPPEAMPPEAMPVEAPPMPGEIIS
jgi:hypothetical protein